MSTVTLGLLQHACSAEPAANLAKTLVLARRAAKRGANIICTQELFQTQYFCQSEKYAHFALAEKSPVRPPGCGSSLPGSMGRSWSPRSSSNGRPASTITPLRSSMPTGRCSGVSEDAHSGRPALLRKILFHAGRQRLPGLADQVWHDRRAHLLGPVVSRGGTPDRAAGAEILFYPTAIGWHPREKRGKGAVQHGAWETIQRAHAVANGCYVAVVNRVGRERPAGGDGLEFWGRSFVAGTSGEILPRPAGAGRRCSSRRWT